MAGKTYVTKGYSTYTNIPGQGGGYDCEPKHPVNKYAVETKTNERARVFVGSPSKVELLKEYVHSPTMMVSPTYAPKNDYEYYEPSSGRGHFSEKSNQIDSGLDLGLGLLSASTSVKKGNYYSVPNKYGHADLRRISVLDKLSTSAQPLEPQKRYARPAFVAKPNDARHYLTNTGSAIDSHEAMRRYRGSRVP